MDGFVWTAILLWNAITIVQDKLLKKQLGLSWGWWAVINYVAFIIAGSIATIITLAIWFYAQFDILKPRDIIVLCSIFALIFGIITFTVQWFVFQKQYLPQPIVLAIFNVLVAIAAYILWARFNFNALWKNDWKPIVGAVVAGAAVGTASGIILDRYCNFINRLEELREGEDE
ncbi:hypothetical protein A4S05_34910 [Nostoc sp. KVJ20]|uniref:hypothetical protein n=1 Tax=Nostoc sp. KVJ20 TaxID=457944 RepID=UPI00083D8A54|nr:hypothetical protein [Nostoc sp. KVJ20]ODH00086.1 hypothetical protein A4S05_34910 [Nostoc sp. KVJ20]